MHTRYEDLVGGVGKAASYRAERFPVRTFFGRQEVRLLLDDQEYSIRDLSMNGLSLLVSPQDLRWAQGRTVDVVVVARDRSLAEDTGPHEDRIYRGTGRVARREEEGSRVHVGLQLLGGFIDLAQVQWNHDRRMFQRELQAGPDAVRRMVPAAYRVAVEHATHFIASLRGTIGQHEKLLKNMGSAGRRHIDELPGSVIERVRRPWSAIREEAAATAPSCFDDSKELRAAKAYTETVLTPSFMDCPVLERAYSKPLGYAGDYQTMVHIYANGLEGQCTFGRAFHKLACEEPLASGVRTRKDVILRLLEREYERFCREQPESAVFRVASLASGPAREVREFVDRDRKWLRPVHYTLVDQEEAALSLAYNDLYRRVQTLRLPVHLSCKHMSFAQFVRNPDRALSTDKQQLVYAAGLFDYLGAASARSLVGSLCDCLAPGGVLAVCNAVKPNYHSWLTEYVVDWHLIYRTTDEMRALADAARGKCTAVLDTEPSSAYHVLLVSRV